MKPESVNLFNLNINPRARDDLQPGSASDRVRGGRSPRLPTGLALPPTLPVANSYANNLATKNEEAQ